MWEIFSGLSSNLLHTGDCVLTGSHHLLPTFTVSLDCCVRLFSYCFCFCLSAFHSLCCSFVYYPIKSPSVPTFHPACQNCNFTPEGNALQNYTRALAKSMYYQLPTIPGIIPEKKFVFRYTELLLFSSKLLEAAPS